MEGITIEASAEAFARDVEEIAKQYEAEGAPITAKYNELLEEAHKIERMARTEYHNAATELNNRYAQRINHAAQIRGSKAARPEYIEKAAKTVTTIMGGPHKNIVTGMTADEARNARRVIENAERKRLEREEYEKKFTPAPGEVF